MEFESVEKKKSENLLIAILGLVIFVVFFFFLIKVIFVSPPASIISQPQIQIQTYILEEQSWKNFWKSLSPFEKLNLPSQEELGESLF
jgi:uncharacterized membrane protein